MNSVDKNLEASNGAGIPEQFLKPYNPEEHETGIYKKWEDSGYFNPDNLPDRQAGLPGDRGETFTVVLPPPNVTGVLHIGHAYENSLQDAVVRFQRMRGKKTLWVPGTDSAAIATQARVEKNIQKDEGKSRHDLGRKELVRRVSEFAESSKTTILNQIRYMGSSLDWSRYAYTMDDSRYKAVMTAFVRMYEAGLIYRGNRIVNWDPKGQTTISDDEIERQDRTGKLYTFKYSKDFPISISTTRPETKVGDSAVAVHPDDERYKKFIGKEYDVTFCDVPLHIKIIADKSVEKDFGTGALGVTPAHSHIDWEIADRHDLPRPQVINEYAKMMVDGRLSEMKVAEARESVVEWLRANDLLENEEEVEQSISVAERSGGVIEPLPKLQWWVSVTNKFTINHSEIPGIKSGSSISLKELMKIAVEKGGVSMPQNGFRSTYYHWIDNLRDWCISRQIWFGHRIPVWYKGEEIYCGEKAPEGDGWEQESDVLDTWFSSALWTFSTLGWPEETEDLKAFHPNSFMSPAYEILPLWVSRMILMSGFHLGQVPFKEVYIHGLVRDAQGRKFSKSLGNGIDPIELIKSYGADATRMGLLVGAPIGSDIKFDEQKIKGYRNFANKVWNITRFVLTNCEDADISKQPNLTGADSKLIKEFDELTSDVTEHLEKYRMDLASNMVYQYMWHRFADEIIEESKTILSGTDSAAALSRQYTLYKILSGSLKLLHPFMPFVTETIWQKLPQKDSDLLMIATWPESHPKKTGFFRKIFTLLRYKHR